MQVRIFHLNDGASGQKIFTQFIPPIATGFGLDGSNFKVTYKYTFAGDVITNNANSNDGRTFDLEIFPVGDRERENNFSHF